VARRFTILAIFLSLLLQSLTGPMVRVERTRDDGCGCRPSAPAPQPDGEGCCCCTKRETPAPPSRDDQPCPCPKGCEQTTRTRDTDTRTAVVQRAAARSVRRATARPLFSTDSAPAALDGLADAAAPLRRRAHAPPPHLVCLRSTVIVV